MKAFIRNIQCWSCDCSHKVSLVVEQRFEGFKTQHWFGWGGSGSMEGEGIDMSTMRKRGHFVEVSQHFCQVYKSCYASQRETVAKSYVWITSVSNSFHCSSVLQPPSQSACVKHKYSNNNQRITPLRLYVTALLYQLQDKKINIYIPCDNHTVTVLRFRTQHGLHSSLRICYE